MANMIALMQNRSRFRSTSAIIFAAIALLVTFHYWDELNWSSITTESSSKSIDIQDHVQETIISADPPVSQGVRFPKEIIYLDPVAPLNPPQLGDYDRELYQDVMIGLNDIEREQDNKPPLSHLRYAILMPTFEGHFPEIIRYLISFKCLVPDYQSVDLNIILSNEGEVDKFRALAEKELNDDCPTHFGPFHIAEQDRAREMPKLNLFNLYDILPASLKGMASKYDTSPLLEKYGKYNYQGIKKLAASRFFDYDWCLWLDSEAIVVQPFSIRAVFDEFVKEPVYFRSRIGRNFPEQHVMANAALTLGRDAESFGSRYYSMESVHWIIEKAVIDDMFKWVESAHGGKDFYDVWLHTGSYSFEISVMVLHIQFRKLESTDSIYSKYKILEIERELIRFGAAAGFSQLSHHLGTGFFERVYLVMAEPSVQPALSAMLNRWHIRFQRMDDFDFTDAATIRRWLLETPVYMLVCGAPDLHAWWADEGA